MRNQKRLDFINNLIDTKPFYETWTMQEAVEIGIIEHGKNCHFGSGAIIGTEGFGYERNENGELIKFPHYGKVVIGDNVDILGPTTITRGSIQDTVIGSGTKIAGNCQVGHNAQIGKHCLIGPHCTISGSSILEDYVTLNSYVIVDHGVRIGTKSEVGTFSYVRRDVEPLRRIFGIPITREEIWSTI